MKCLVPNRTLLNSYYIFVVENTKFAKNHSGAQFFSMRCKAFLLRWSTSEHIYSFFIFQIIPLSWIEHYKWNLDELFLSIDKKSPSIDFADILRFSAVKILYSQSEIKNFAKNRNDAWDFFCHIWQQNGKRRELQNSKRKAHKDPSEITRNRLIPYNWHSNLKGTSLLNLFWPYSTVRA